MIYEKHPERVGLVTGAMTAVALIAYFLIMRAAGLADILELRVFNFFILLAGIAWTIKRHSTLTASRYNYFSTLGNGCLAAIVATSVFAIFMLVYLLIDHDFLRIIQHNATFGSQVTPMLAAILVFGEGFGSGMIMAYIALFYIHNRRIQTTPES
jgi:hypothetical protein